MNHEKKQPQEECQPGIDEMLPTLISCLSSVQVSQPPKSTPQPRFWVEIIAAIFMMFSLLTFLAFEIIDWTNNEGKLLCGLIFAVFATCSLGTVLAITWKNLSTILAKQLLSEVNIVLVIMLLTFDFVIDIWSRSSTKFSPVFGIMWIIAVIGSLVSHAIKSISWRFSVFFSCYVVVIVSYNIIISFISKACSDLDDDKIWISFSHKLTKVEIKRLLHVEVFILLLTSVYVGIRDPTQRYISFPIGVVVKKPVQKCQMPIASKRSISSWLFTGNNLAELFSSVVGLIGLVLFFLYQTTWAVVLAIISIMACVLFVLKGNTDTAVLSLVLRQFSVVVTLMCCVLNVVWNAATYGDAQFILAGFLFMCLLLLNISLDAVRIVSRAFRLCASLATIAICLRLLSSVILENEPCDSSDVLFQSTKGRVTAMQFKRMLLFVIICGQLRPWILLFFKSDKHTLYFVTTNVQKQFVLDHSDKDGRGGLYLWIANDDSLARPVSSSAITIASGDSSVSRVSRVRPHTPESNHNLDIRAKSQRHSHNTIDRVLGTCGGGALHVNLIEA